MLGGYRVFGSLVSRSLVTEDDCKFIIATAARQRLVFGYATTRIASCAPTDEETDVGG